MLKAPIGSAYKRKGDDITALLRKHPNGSLRVAYVDKVSFTSSSSAAAAASASSSSTSSFSSSVGRRSSGGGDGYARNRSRSSESDRSGGEGGEDGGGWHSGSGGGGMYGSSEDNGPTFYSVLVEWDTSVNNQGSISGGCGGGISGGGNGGGGLVEVYRVKLPGEPIRLVGEPKANNQNQALPFVRGLAVQAIDMNQVSVFFFRKWG